MKTHSSSTSRASSRSPRAASRGTRGSVPHEHRHLGPRRAARPRDPRPAAARRRRSRRERRGRRRGRRRAAAGGARERERGGRGRAGERGGRARAHHRGAPTVSGSRRARPRPPRTTRPAARRARAAARARPARAARARPARPRPARRRAWPAPPTAPPPIMLRAVSTASPQQALVAQRLLGDLELRELLLLLEPRDLGAQRRERRARVRARRRDRRGVQPRQAEHGGERDHRDQHHVALAALRRHGTRADHGVARAAVGSEYAWSSHWHGQRRREGRVNNGARSAPGAAPRRLGRVL